MKNAIKIKVVSGNKKEWLVEVDVGTATVILASFSSRDEAIDAAREIKVTKPRRSQQQ